MPPIESCPLPLRSVLQPYAGGPGYADCYRADLPRRVSQAEFIEAFYSTGLFKLERRLLGWVARRPATDHDARQLSLGAVTVFSAWRVEAQTPAQLLLCDVTGRTRSWLMAVPADADAGREAGVGGTRLYFGSAVVPLRAGAGGRSGMGWGFHALLGFHRLYARLLLGAARSRLLQRS